MAQSGLEIDEALAPRVATVMGSALGGMGTIDENYKLTYREGKTRVHPFLVPRLMANAPASHLSMRHGAKGPNWTVSRPPVPRPIMRSGRPFIWCVAGMADAALAGGAEAALNWGTHEGLGRVCG